MLYCTYPGEHVSRAMSAPQDLMPLPTMPWDERPIELPLDIEECRTALWRNGGNITKAAAMLKVTSDRLRRFVKQSPRLVAEQLEFQQQMLDLAEDNLVEALTDPEDTTRKDIATKFVLKELGGSRGYGTSKAALGLSMGPRGKLVIEWGDPNDVPFGPVIEHDE